MTTLDDHLRETDESARKEWGDYVSRCAIGNMKALALQTGLVPRNFAITSKNDPLRLLLREFGWDV